MEKDLIGPKSTFDFSAPITMGADLRTWSRILWNHRKDLQWKFLPKLFALTFMVGLYTPLRWWERLRYDRKIKATEVKDPVFIIGHQRSGTTYLHYLLGKDPSFGHLSWSESFMPWIFLAFGGHVKRILERNMPQKRPMDDLKMSPDLPTEPEYAMGNMTWATMVPGIHFPQRINDVFKDHILFRNKTAKRAWQKTLLYLLQKLTYRHGGKQLIIKSPENLGRVNEILEVFPNAKFVHIHRDPYRVYFSTERLYGITIPLVALQHCKRRHVQEFIFRSYREIFEKFFAEKSLIPAGNLVEVRYEDLIGNELSEVRRIYEELGMGMSDEATEAVQAEVSEYKNYKTNTYAYDEEAKQRIQREWAAIFKQLGYVT